MAQKFTDTKKWDDDWFLGLPPEMKCVWIYITDTCDGSGFSKLSFNKMSGLIGAKISREEFDFHFSERIFWLSDDEFWIPGVIKAQYKKISLANIPRRNLVRHILDMLKDRELTGKALDVYSELKDLWESFHENSSGSVRASSEARPSPKYTDTDKDKDKYNNKRKRTEFLETEIERIYRDHYPRKEGKSEGVKRLLRDLSPEDIPDFERAVIKYRRFCEDKGTETQFIKLFSTFANHWRDVLEENFGTSNIQSKDWDVMTVPLRGT